MTEENKETRPIFSTDHKWVKGKDGQYHLFSKIGKTWNHPDSRLSWCRNAPIDSMSDIKLLTRRPESYERCESCFEMKYPREGKK